MAIHHPFENLSSKQYRALFLISLAATILLMSVMSSVGKPLKTQAAPAGIISFEFAGNEKRASEIIRSWDETARLHAAFSLGLDYLFMVAYSNAIGLACLWAGKILLQRNWPLAGAGVPLAWAQWIAALLDATENVGLVVLLLDAVASPWPAIATISASVKFALVVVGLVYAAYGAAAWTRGALAGSRKYSF